METKDRRRQESPSVRLKCQRCGREWDYKGKSKWYTSCPTCKTTVKVK